MLVIIGILSTVATLGMLAYARAQQESATAQTVLTSLRSAAARAESQGSTFCVYFESSSEWTTWQYSCDPSETTTPRTPAQVGSSRASGVGEVASLTMAPNPPSGPSFASMCPTSGRCIFFYPQGLATGASLTVERSNDPNGKRYTINVDGLTSRVYFP